MGGQVLTADCNAVGGMEWQVLLFDTVPVTTVYSLMLHKSHLFPKMQTFAKLLFIFNLKAQNAAHHLFKIPCLVRNSELYHPFKGM